LDVDLFYTTDSAPFMDLVSRRLERTFQVRVKDRGVLDVVESARDRPRRQYDAYVLLDYLVRCMTSETALWVMDRDIFCEGVNFVFGLAMYHIAAVVSIYRLDSPAMVAKEAVHEMGHVMGLQHCKDRCVMRFSNTFDDALEKPEELCVRCRSLLNRKLVEPGLQM
jgi:archaemetzincin